MIKKPKGIPSVDLPREKLINTGVESLSERDLIAVILRSGVRNKNVMELADEILGKYTLSELSGASVDDLTTIPGIGETRAAAIIAAFELRGRLEKEQKSLKPLLDTPEKVFKYVSDIHKAKREKFIAVYMDNRMKVIKKAHISIGSVSASIVHPREVFKPAIENNASQVIVVHNHPSQDATPSKEDVSITRKLAEAGEIMGIPLVDHIIVTSDSYYSFKERGQL
ncbi:DNA repair protein RadC [Elusimicrobiota bacterium]